MKDRYVILTIFAILGGFLLTVLITVRTATHHFDKVACQGKEKVLQLDTQFVDYSYFSWDCVAEINGRIVPVDTVNNDTGVWLRGNGTTR